MRIGLSGGAATVDQMIEQAVQAEADGFSALWYSSVIGGDPLVVIALAGRATTTIELGTSVLQTYTAHPVLQANRALAVAAAMGRPGFTLGVGPSHAPVVEHWLGLSYATPGRHTEEYVSVLAPLLRGEAVQFAGDEFRVNQPAKPTPPAPVELMVAGLAPRLLRVAGQQTAGTILWMANARSIESHVLPRLQVASGGAPRRIVAGLPVAVHDDVDEARAAAAKQFAMYATLPNYQRIMALGGISSPAEAAIVGDEASVTAQLQALFDAGATDVWAAEFTVGSDKAASRARTRTLLTALAVA